MAIDTLNQERNQNNFYVNPALYPNGTAVTYTATICNQTYYSVSYYSLMSVPNNQYNKMTISNNDKKAYIRRVTASHPNAEIYFQTEENITPTDIAISKLLNEVVKLMDYYNNIIRTSWVKWSPNTPLPMGVVMLASFVPDLKKDELFQVNFDVTMEISRNTMNHFVNHSSFKYYCTGSGLEYHSNALSIANIPKKKRKTRFVAYIKKMGLINRKKK